MATATASGGDGGVRAFARKSTRRGEKGPRGSERVQGVRGVVQRLLGASGSGGSRRWLWRVAAGAEHALVLLSRRKTTGRSGLGWPAGPARPCCAGPAQVSLPFLFFFSIFF